ncbi:MAG: hypothetical protein ACE5KO_02770, partial [Candidatus Bathyarchaeia archaeon]
MKRSTLHQLHAELGAIFTNYHGWEFPLRYGNSSEEHMAVRENVGVTDLSYRSKFRVTGTDRASWVHGLVTNDVNNLKHGGGLYATMLSHIGRMITDLKVYARPEYLILDVHPANAEKVADILKKSIISEDVELEDLTHLLTIISVNGPRSLQLVRHLFKKSFSRNHLEDYDNV